MTEGEWLTATDPELMYFAVLDSRPSDRKLRLFGCAVCRLVPALMSSLSGRAGVDLTEQDTDNPGAEVRFEGLEDTFDFQWNRRDGRDLADRAWDLHWCEVCLLGFPAGADLSSHPEVLDRQAKLKPLLRDIFGNPFRPVTFAPEWRTETAVSLAQTMYDARDFGNLPVLADALQDAGCENADVLDHCRGPGPHVRGCWVVDLVLGKA